MHESREREKSAREYKTFCKSDLKLAPHHRTDSTHSLPWTKYTWNELDGAFLRHQMKVFNVNMEQSINILHAIQPADFHKQQGITVGVCARKIILPHDFQRSAILRVFGMERMVCNQKRAHIVYHHKYEHNQFYSSHFELKIDDSM